MEVREEEEEYKFIPPLPIKLTPTTHLPCLPNSQTVRIASEWGGVRAARSEQKTQTLLLDWLSSQKGERWTKSCQSVLNAKSPCSSVAAVVAGCFSLVATGTAYLNMIQAQKKSARSKLP